MGPFDDQAVNGDLFRNAAQLIALSRAPSSEPLKVLNPAELDGQTSAALRRCVSIARSAARKAVKENQRERIAIATSAFERMMRPLYRLPDDDPAGPMRTLSVIARLWVLAHRSFDSSPGARAVLRDVEAVLPSMVLGFLSLQADPRLEAVQSALRLAEICAPRAPEQTCYDDAAVVTGVSAPAHAHRLG